MIPRWISILLTMLLTGSSGIASESRVDGKWKCVGKGFSEQDIHFVLELKQSGNVIAGTVTIDSDVVSISEGEIEGNKMKLIVNTDDNSFVSEVVIEPAKISATWSDATGRSGTWSGTRVPDNETSKSK